MVRFKSIIALVLAAAMSSLSTRVAFQEEITDEDMTTITSDDLIGY